MNKNRDFSTEFSIKASRSGGKGGQHVNKVSSKVELTFHPEQSQLLTQAEKQVLLEKWKNRLSAEGFIRIIAQEDRSQLKNKEKAIKKFYDLLKRGLHQPKKRIAVKVSAALVEERLQDKKLLSQKKSNRKKILP